MSFFFCFRDARLQLAHGRGDLFIFSYFLCFFSSVVRPSILPSPLAEKNSNSGFRPRRGAVQVCVLCRGKSCRGSRTAVGRDHLGFAYCNSPVYPRVFLFFCDAHVCVAGFCNSFARRSDATFFNAHALEAEYKRRIALYVCVCVQAPPCGRKPAILRGVLCSRA